MKKSILIPLLISAAFIVTACGGKQAESKPVDESQPEQSQPEESQPSESQPSGGEGSSQEDAITVTLSEKVMSVGINETAQLFATSNLGGASFVWSSSDATVATVDQQGNVKGLKEGTAIITAQLTGRNEKDTCEVTVVGDYFIEEDTEILVQTTFNDTFLRP